jgi:transcriptional regulator with GAF, ATPase, and Fis domain
MFTLTAYTGDTPRTRLLDKRSFIIGKAPDCDIVLAHGRAPDVAARIECDGSGAVIHAVKAGCVAINGRKKPSARLSPGDRIDIGADFFICGRETSKRQAPAPDGRPVLENLTRFSDVVGQERDLKKLLRKVIDSLFSVIGGEEAFVFVLDGRGKPQVMVSSGGAKTSPERFSDTVVQTVLKSRTGVVVRNALADPAFSASQSIADLRLTTVLCTPMIAAGRMIGIIYLGSRKSGTSFTDDDLGTLRLYALIAGMLINHVDFIAQQNETIRRLADVKEEGGVIAASPAMRRIMDDIATVARSDIPVLLEGETGTGKDLLAEMVHRKSDRKNGPFLPVNCSSLRGELLESELFGHKQGAFTGAMRDHRGLFSAAHKGTIFLDEISELEQPLQAKLLRTLETGRVRPVGSSSEETVDVRIICAANRDLKSMIAQGAFRQDLYFRLNQFAIQLPPLRERGEDILLLAYHFLDKFRILYPNRDIVDFHPDARKSLLLYDWPGNVRELSSVIHKAVLSASGPLVMIDVGDAGPEKSLDFDQTVRDFQFKLIKRALDACNGNREQAARMLGMSRSNFFRYLAEMKA